MNKKVQQLILLLFLLPTLASGVVYLPAPYVNREDTLQNKDTSLHRLIQSDHEPKDSVVAVVDTMQMDSVAIDTIPSDSIDIVAPLDSVAIDTIPSDSIDIVAPLDSETEGQALVDMVPRRSNHELLIEYVVVVDSCYPYMQPQDKIVVIDTRKDSRYAKDYIDGNHYVIKFRGETIRVPENMLANNPVLSNSLKIELTGLSVEAKKILWDAALAAFEPKPDLTFADTIVVNKLFLPLIYSEKISPQSHYNRLALEEWHDGEGYQFGLPNWLRRATELDTMRQSRQYEVINNAPELAEYAASALPAIPMAQVMNKAATSNMVTVNTLPVFDDKPLNMGLPQLPRWTKKTTSAVQLSQMYVSDNWYQGGQNNLNLNSTQSFNLTYDDMKSVKFTTNVLWKLGLNSAPDDTVHSMRVNEDLFRLESNLGIKAFDSWYYTLSGIFNTQLFNTYVANSETVKTTLLSPSDFNLGLGMQYSYSNKPAGFSCNVIMAPLAYNLTFVVDSVSVDPTSFGIPDGLSKSEIGSNFEIKTSWSIRKDLTWSSRLFYYTNYERVLCDFENTFNLIFNQYFSTRLFFHLRFDDSTHTPDTPLFQTKELISVGFNYKW